MPQGNKEYETQSKKIQSPGGSAGAWPAPWTRSLSPATCTGIVWEALQSSRCQQANSKNARVKKPIRNNPVKPMNRNSSLLRGPRPGSPGEAQGSSGHMPSRHDPYLAMKSNACILHKHLVPTPFPPTCTTCLSSLHVRTTGSVSYWPSKFTFISSFLPAETVKYEIHISQVKKPRLRQGKGFRI